MTIGRAARTAERRGRAEADFGADAPAALAVLELWELAWHDCFGEVAPPEQVEEDVWLLAGGRLFELVLVVHAATTDFRDVRVMADRARKEQGR